MINLLVDLLYRAIDKFFLSIKKVLYNVPECKLTSAYFLFYPTKCPKPKHICVIIIKKEQILKNCLLFA